MSEIKRLYEERDNASTELAEEKLKSQNLSDDCQQLEAEVDILQAKLSNASMLQDAALLAGRSAAAADRPAAASIAPPPIATPASALDAASFLQRVREMALPPKAAPQVARDDEVNYELYATMAAKYEAEESAKAGGSPDATAGVAVA